MLAHDFADEPQRAELAAQPIADDGVLLHQLEFSWRQRRRFQQERVWNANLADVMEIPAAVEGGKVLSGASEHGAERDGVVREPFAVAVGVLIAGFDDEGKAAQDLFGGVEVVGVLLEPYERRDPRLEFLGIERLADEVIGARLEAANLVLARVEAGHERDRDEAGVQAQPSAARKYQSH